MELEVGSGLLLLPLAAAAAGEIPYVALGVAYNYGFAVCWDATSAVVTLLGEDMTAFVVLACFVGLPGAD